MKKIYSLCALTAFFALSVPSFVYGIDQQRRLNLQYEARHGNKKAQEELDRVNREEKEAKEKFLSMVGIRIG
ncbi:MAG: hypothetical protein UU47_C0003G0050 [candidate division TM6 bacterium GW2011_GWE2_41_16]|nr:MAG: hypothetical protein UU47_C0003G0050 [candidate division TM6 bacterium GW2011_GWE2_41_16]